MDTTESENEKQAILEFFYLALERYGFSPEQAAREFNTSEAAREFNVSDKNSLMMVAALEKSIVDGRIHHDGIPEFWDEGEMLSYARQFLKHLEVAD